MLLCRTEAPQLRADIGLFLQLPSPTQAWDDFEEDFGSSHEVWKEADQLRAIVEEGDSVLASLYKAASTVPQSVRSAVAAAQLFETFPAPSLAWLELENEQALQTVATLRNLVSLVSEAQPDKQHWLDAELQPLLSSLKLQAMLKSDDLEHQILDLESESLTTEYNQLTQLLDQARIAFSELAESTAATAS